MDSLIKTDLTLFGFPVWFDWRLDRNIVDLRHPRGDRIRIVIQPEHGQESAGSSPASRPEE